MFQFDCAAQPVTEPSTPKKEGASPVKEPSTPSSRRTGQRSKAVLKQQMREQKVMEKKMALRRHRRHNPRYVSDEFTSIFTEKKVLCDNSYNENEVCTITRILTGCHSAGNIPCEAKGEICQCLSQMPWLWFVN